MAPAPPLAENGQRPSGGLRNGLGWHLLFLHTGRAMIPARSLPVAAVILFTCGPILAATTLAADDAAESACHQKDTTVAIMDCLDGLTAQWDTRLNAAYQAALKASESPAREDALIRAERAWLAYRKCNCAAGMTLRKERSERSPGPIACWA